MMHRASFASSAAIFVSLASPVHARQSCGLITTDTFDLGLTTPDGYAIAATDDLLVTFSSAGPFDPTTFAPKIVLHDMSQPGATQVIAEVDSGNSIQSFGVEMRIDNQTLWIYSTTPGFATAWPIDISDPSNIPMPPLQFDFFRDWPSVALPGTLGNAGVTAFDDRGNDILMVFDDQWLRVLDVSDFGAPQVLSETRILLDDEQRNAGGVFHEDLLIVTGQGRTDPTQGVVSDMVIVDVSDHLAPVIIGSLTVPGRALGRSISTDDQYLVVCGGSAPDGAPYLVEGLAFEFSDPTQPVLIGSMWSAESGVVRDGIAYTSSRVQDQVCFDDLVTWDLRANVPVVRCFEDDAPDNFRRRLSQVGVDGPLLIERWDQDFTVAAAVELILPSTTPVELADTVFVIEPTTIEPEATEIAGFPLGLAKIIVSGAGVAVHPDIQPPVACAGMTSGSLTIEGVHSINSINVLGQSQLIVEGELTTGLLSMSASTALVNGRIVAEDLELLEGAVLSHTAESTMGAP